MSEFEGKIVVVTGAAGALGGACAAHFAGLGARLALLDVIEIPGKHFSRQCDLTDAGACKTVIDEIEKQVGPMDVLCNIAGGFAMGEAVHETSDDTWTFLMGLNARSVLNMARAAVPRMLARKRGKIVNIGAGAGQHALAQMGAYSASKSVVIRLTEAMAGELKTQGINVNCILPSVIDTPANRKSMPDADFDTWVKPADMAKVIAFLASEDAAPIHGAALPVSGLS
jgi:NAD(P)-dependent dehydrogenase (short-subunit alcohol dehydrogenase family)